jgi:hypothetical protein
MEAFCQEYMKELYALYGDYGKAIEGLTPEALDWLPGDGMNNIAVLFAHATGAQRFLVGDLVGGIESHRNRNAEFAVRGLDEAALRAMLSQSLDAVNSALEKLTVDELNSPAPRTKDGRSFSVAAALNHALAHTGVHLGHIQMTRQLWENRR